MSVGKGQQFLEDEDGQLHFNFPDTAAHLSRMSRRRTFDLQPHEMSPEEFINHPDTLFHASNLKHIEGLQPFNAKNAAGRKERDYDDYPEAREMLDKGLYGPTEVMNSNYTHAGSELAAYERMEALGHLVHVHAVHVPNKDFRERIIDDNEANANLYDDELTDYIKLPLDHPDKDLLDNMPHYYRNDAEDSSSFSAVIPRTHALTHADYVKQALEQGKGDEIHPETLKRYQEGTLSSIAETTDLDTIDKRLQNQAVSEQLRVGGDLFTGIDERHTKNELLRIKYGSSIYPHAPSVSYGYPKRVYGSSTLPIFETERGNLPYDNSWIDYKPEDEKNG